MAAGWRPRAAGGVARRAVGRRARRRGDRLRRRLRQPQLSRCAPAQGCRRARPDAGRAAGDPRRVRARRGVPRDGVTERRSRSSSRRPRSDTAPRRWATTRSSARAQRRGVAFHADRPADAPGELVLIDAGAQQLGYVSDITRTFCVGGVMSEHPAGAARDRSRRAACRDRACGARASNGGRSTGPRRSRSPTASAAADPRGAASRLVGLRRGRAVLPARDRDLVGLGVRDAGEPLYERRHDPPPYPNLRSTCRWSRAGRHRRAGRLLRAGAAHRIPSAARGIATRSYWDAVDRLMDFGGVRIEDNLLVTAGPRGDHRRRSPAGLIRRPLTSSRSGRRDDLRGAGSGIRLLSAWSFCMPSRIRPLTVPVGSPRCTAISVCEQLP